MYNATDIAAYIFHRYQSEYGEKIDEMKLHKLLYLSQMQSLIDLGGPLFVDHFQAWKFGPVLVNIRYRYKNNGFNNDDHIILDTQTKTVVDKVYDKYSNINSWDLNGIIYGHIAWKNARKGLAHGANSRNLIRIDDMIKDAELIRQQERVLNDLKPSEDIVSPDLR